MAHHLPVPLGVIGEASLYDVSGVTSPIAITTTTDIPPYVAGSAVAADRTGVVIAIVYASVQEGDLGAQNAGIDETAISDDATDPGGTGQPGNAYSLNAGQLGNIQNLNNSPTGASMDNGMGVAMVQCLPYWGLPAGSNITIPFPTTPPPDGVRVVAAYALAWQNFAQAVEAFIQQTQWLDGPGSWDGIIADSPEYHFFDSMLTLFAQCGGNIQEGPVDPPPYDHYNSVVVSTDGLDETTGLEDVLVPVVGFDGVGGGAGSDSTGLVYGVWERDSDGNTDVADQIGSIVPTNNSGIAIIYAVQIVGIDVPDAGNPCFNKLIPV